MYDVPRPRTDPPSTPWLRCSWMLESQDSNNLNSKRARPGEKAKRGSTAISSPGVPLARQVSCKKDRSVEKISDIFDG